MLEHVIGVTVIVVPFIILVIWSFRHNSQIDEDRLEHLERLTQALNGKKDSGAFEATFELKDVAYRTGIGHGGENDPSIFYVSRDQEPFPDGVIFIFEHGINRWVSKKLSTGDKRFDDNVCYQISVKQNRDDKHEIAQRLCKDAAFREALLRIKKAGFSHVSIPGAFQEGSITARISQQFLGDTNLLMAYVTNPKAKHYKAEHVRSIAESLAVLSDQLNP